MHLWNLKHKVQVSYGDHKRSRMAFPSIPAELPLSSRDLPAAEKLRSAIDRQILDAVQGGKITMKRHNVKECKAGQPDESKREPGFPWYSRMYILLMTPSKIRHRWKQDATHEESGGSRKSCLLSRFLSCPFRRGYLIRFSEKVVELFSGGEKQRCHCLRRLA